LISIYTWPSYGRIYQMIKPWSSSNYRYSTTGAADDRLETRACTQKWYISDWQSRSTSTTRDWYTSFLLWYRVSFSTLVFLQRQLLHLDRLAPYSPWATWIHNFPKCYVSCLTETLLRSSKYINVWMTSIIVAVVIEKERVVPLWSLMTGKSLQFHCIYLLF